MPTYITMLKWTPNGIQNIKGSPGRLDQARSQFATMGVTLKDVYLTMGRHDLICVLDAPDSQTVAKAILGLATAGSVTSETLAAFTENEYRSIIGSL
jgi:uncharacterized protein with GYD domain